MPNPNDTPSAIECAIRSGWDTGDLERAATLMVEHYGPELLGFLINLTRDTHIGREIFGQLCEELWRSWPRFEWRCSVRTWAYKVARHVANSHRRSARRWAREDTLQESSLFSAAAERVRTATQAYLRTRVKERFRELRAQLPTDDQSLLILRIERGMNWLERAEVMLADEVAPTPEQLKTEAARLRKRFQLAKERLRKLVEDAGLLEHDDL